MVFCNVIVYDDKNKAFNGHNPYFNRWFSAIHEESCKIEDKTSHNPYFNRWFSAIRQQSVRMEQKQVTILILIDGFLQYRFCDSINLNVCCHNPYFNRWFSAIRDKAVEEGRKTLSQSLF